VLELFLLEIVVEKNNGIKRGGRGKKRVFKSCFLDPPFYKTPTFLSLFLDF